MKPKNFLFYFLFIFFLHFFVVWIRLKPVAVIFLKSLLSASNILLVALKEDTFCKVVIPE